MFDQEAMRLIQSRPVIHPVISPVERPATSRRVFRFGRLRELAAWVRGVGR